jgi:hypothetical protein
MMGRGNIQIALVSAVLVNVVVAYDDCNGGNVVKGRGEGGEGAGNASPLHFQQDLTAWGSIQTTADCFPHPYWIYEKCLSTFICCG